MIQIIRKAINTLNNFVTLFNWNTWIFSWVKNVGLFIENRRMVLIEYQILVRKTQLYIFIILSIHLVASECVFLPGIERFIKLFMVIDIFLFIYLTIMWLIRWWKKWVLNCCSRSSLWTSSSWTGCYISYYFPSC